MLSTRLRAAMLELRDGLLFFFFLMHKSGSLGPARLHSGQVGAVLLGLGTPPANARQQSPLTTTREHRQLSSREAQRRPRGGPMLAASRQRCPGS